jgi:hypothetical protein
MSGNGNSSYLVDILQLMFRHVIACITLCGLLASCTGSYYDIHGTEPVYMANKMHMPFFSKADQTQLELSYTGSFEFAGGYSITDNIALVSSLRLKDSPTSDTDFHHNRNFDIGAGYFLDSLDAFRVEAFAHIGYGRTNTSDRYNPWDFPAAEDTTVSFGVFAYDYMKYSLQLNGGWEWKNWALGMSFRGGYMNLQNITRNIKTLHNDSVVTNSFLHSKGTGFFEMAWGVRCRVVNAFWLELNIVVGGIYETIGFREPDQVDEGDADGGVSLTLFCKF